MGRTGYPLVDAAMRQLNGTGYMHNRLRMLTASFLTKDLGIDWRRGEAYFARQLNDFDLSANNGGWQWAASSGCDAQPYFRIFNPVTQSQRFDPAGRFIRRYLPELAAVPDQFLHAPWRMSLSEQAACGVRIGRDFPAPLVEHAQARLRTLQRYAWSSLALLPDVSGYQAQQFVFLIGLAEIVIDAQLDGVLAVFVCRSRGDHDDRHRSQAFVGTHVAGELETVHARHFDVDQQTSGTTATSCSSASTPSLAVITW
jgi:hypothetical protein